MNERSLRLEPIRLDAQTNERMVDLKARRHVAVLAVGMTTGAGASAAAVLGQAPWGPAAGVAMASGTLVLSQVRAFGALQRQLDQGRKAARTAIEKLMTSEVEPDDDEAAEAEPRV